MQPSFSAEPVRLSSRHQPPSVDGLRDAYSSLADDGSLSEQLKEAGMLFSVAEGHLSDADAAEALKAASDALQIFREAGNAKGVADTQRIITGAHCLVEDYTEARRTAEGELAEFRKSEDKRGEAAMLLSLSEVNLAEEKLKEALASASDAREIFGAQGDSKMEAVTFLTIAKIRVAEEMHREAIRSANAALLLFQKTGDSKGRAQGLRVLTGAYLTGGAVKEGLQSGEAAASLFRELGSRRDEAYELHRMATVQMENQKYQEATNLAKKAHGIFQEIKFAKGEHLAVDLLAKVSLEKGQETWALSVAKEGLERFQEAGEKRWEAAVLGDTLLEVHIRRGSLEEALFTADSSLALCKEIGDRKWEAKMLENVGTVHILKREFEQATKFGLDASILFQDLGDLKNAGCLHYKLSGMRHQQGDHKAALEEVSEARNHFQKAGSRASETTALLGMCYAHQVLGDTESAMGEAMEAIKISEDMGDQKGHAAAWLNIAAMNMMASRLAETLEAASKAESLLRDHGSAHKLLADTLHLITQAHLSSGEPALAARPAHEARIIYQRIRDAAGEADTLRLLAHIDQDLLAKEVKEPNPNTEKHWRMVARLQETAVRSARAAVESFRKLGAQFPLGAALHTLAQALANAQEPDEALKAADEAVEIFQEIGDKGAEANALVVTADANMIKGDRQRATNAANAAAAIFRESGDAAGETLAMGIFQDVTAQAALQPALVEGAQSVSKKVKLDPAVVMKMVKEKALEVLTVDEEEAELYLDTPLMDAGLDSLSVIGFRDSLQQEYPGLNLPAEMTFDYPSIHALAGFICEGMEALG